MTNHMTRVGGLFAVAVLLATGAIQASAQVQNPGDPNGRLWTPFAAGTISPGNGAASGSWYAYETSSNAFGFFLRGYSASTNKLWTIAPYETLADGRVQYWWMEYAYFNGGDPEDTHFWQDSASGRMVMGDGIGIPGVGWCITLNQTVGGQSVPVQDQWRQIAFSLTVGDMGRVDPQPQPRPKPQPDPRPSGCDQCNGSESCLCVLREHYDECPASK